MHSVEEPRSHATANHHSSRSGRQPFFLHPTGCWVLLTSHFSPRRLLVTYSHRISSLPIQVAGDSPPIGAKLVNRSTTTRCHIASTRTIPQYPSMGMSRLLSRSRAHPIVTLVSRHKSLLRCSPERHEPLFRCVQSIFLMMGAAILLTWSGMISLYISGAMYFTNFLV